MNNRPKILVVEDDEVSLIIAEHVLSQKGYAVETVDNGEDAIEMVKKEPFQLILMDIEMPIMSGLEATPQIRTLLHGKNIPIIALTAHSTPDKIKEFGKAGIDDYILKPFNPEKFDQIAERYLGNKP